MLQQDCPNGRLTPAKFVDMYKMFFPSGNAEEFCDHVFRTFDMDKNGYIDFKVSPASFLRDTIGADCCNEPCNNYRAPDESSKEDTCRATYLSYIDHSAWLNIIATKSARLKEVRYSRRNTFIARRLHFYDVEISFAWI